MTIRKNALIAAMLAGVAALPAQADIDVDVDISVGAITILYAFSDLDVDISSATLASLLATGTCGLATAGNQDVDCDLGDAGAINATVVGTDLEGTPANDITTSIGGITPDLSAVQLTVNDVWAVRAIGGATANTTVGVTLGADTTLTSGTSEVEITAAAVPAGQATFPDPGLGTPTTGDVELTLDLTGVTASGNHDSGNDTGDVVYTVSVTGT